MAVIVVLFALAAGGLWVTWRFGLWGRYAARAEAATETSMTSSGNEQAAPRPAQSPQGSETDEGAQDVVQLEIHSTPPGATVTLDGQQVGSTPYETALRRSDVERQLTVTSDGYVPVERTIRNTKSQRLEFELQPLER